MPGNTNFLNPNVAISPQGNTSFRPSPKAELLGSSGRTIMLGDSLTLGDRTPSPPGRLGTVVVGRDPLYWAQVLSDQRVVYQRNAGAGGNTSGNMLSRIYTDVINYNPAWCVVLAGTNDAALAVSMTTFKANMTSIITTLIDSGINPVMCTIPARNPASGAENALTKIHEQFNEWIRYYAASNNIPLADFYNLLNDPATGGLATKYCADGLHPSGLACFVMGQALSDVMSPFIAAPASALLTNNLVAATNNILTGGLFLTDSGAPVGMGAGWTSGLGSSTPTLVTDATIVGKWQRITSTAAGVSASLTQDVSSASWSPGETLRFSGLIQATLAASTYGEPSSPVILLINGATLSYLAPAWTMTTLASVPYGYTLPKHAWHSEYVIPTGTTSIVLYLSFTSGTVSGGWVQWAQVSCVNLSRLGVPARLPAYA